MNLPERAEHDSWVTAAGTFMSYGLILAGMTLVVFGIPYLIFLVF